VSGLGIATVYRNLKALQEEERIIQVDIPGQPPRWEMVPAITTITSFAYV